MTIEQLRAAVGRALRDYGADEPDLADELVAIADHHAAEEAAAAAREKTNVAWHVPIR